jgi:hypothetical protein
MNLRLLVIGEEERKRAAEIVAYASRPHNLYHPGARAKVPGDQPEHVAHFGDFRAVFSWTKVKTGVFRHLSVSVGEHTNFPNPVMVEELARLFGFTGGYGQWQVEADIKSVVVIVTQRVHDVGA